MLALHIAAENNSTAVAHHLLQRGAHVDAVDSYGRTPLHLAATIEDIKVYLHNPTMMIQHDTQK
jgi:ankyrin repeat protein